MDNKVSSDQSYVSERGRDREARDRDRRREPSLAGTAKQSEHSRYSKKELSVVGSTASRRTASAISSTNTARQAPSTTSTAIRYSSRKPTARSELSSLTLNPRRVEGYVDPNTPPSEVGTIASISTRHESASVVGEKALVRGLRNGVTAQDDRRNEREAKDARERLANYQGVVPLKEKERKLHDFSVESGRRTRASSLVSKSRDSMMSASSVAPRGKEEDRNLQRRPKSRVSENRRPYKESGGVVYHSSIEQSSKKVMMSDDLGVTSIEVGHRRRVRVSEGDYAPDMSQYRERSAPSRVIEGRHHSVASSDTRPHTTGRQRAPSISPIIITDDYPAGLRRVRRGSISQGGGGAPPMKGPNSHVSSCQSRDTDREPSVASDSTVKPIKYQKGFSDFGPSETGVKTIISDAPSSSSRHTITSSRPSGSWVSHVSNSEPPVSHSGRLFRTGASTITPSTSGGSRVENVIRSSRPPTSNHNYASSSTKRSGSRVSSSREREDEW